MSRSFDLELRELRQAGERLENATKEWVVAYRLYVGAVDALAKPQKRLQNRQKKAAYQYEVSATCLKLRHRLIKSPRAELAQRILRALAEGISVSIADAFQLRNWANKTSDAVGTLEESARHILKQENYTH